MQEVLDKAQWSQAKNDIDRRLVGLPAWNVRLGHGSFVTFEFGAAVTETLPRRGQTYVHGEWHLWIYLASWTARDGSEVVHYEASREELARWLTRLEGKALLAVDAAFSSRVTVLKFEGSIEISIVPFEDSQDDDDVWALFLPDGYVLHAMSSGLWRKVKADGSDTRSQTDRP